MNAFAQEQLLLLPQAGFDAPEAVLHSPLYGKTVIVSTHIMSEAEKLCDRIGISGAKVYIQGRNLGMLASSVDFMDLDTGATYFNRGFTVGLQLDF